MEYKHTRMIPRLEYMMSGKGITKERDAEGEVDESQEDLKMTIGANDRELTSVHAMQEAICNSTAEGKYD